jgi:HAE1 family hydrophobic/amphiphilic exporter-1
MKVVQDSIRFPVTTAVAVILLVLFGGIALLRIPIQLTPTVEEPEITVTTTWPGASPKEVEREIIEEQEEQLKSLEGLIEMESSSADSMGTITLTFQVGSDIDAATLRVSNRLEQVPSYPEDVDKPVIRSVDVNANAIGWFTLLPSGDKPFEGDISTLYDFVDDYIKPEFERVPGVAAANIYGGREREMHVIVDPARLAARQVTLNQLAAALDRENRNYSGGDFSEGKRRYIVRTVGEYLSPRDIENVVIAVKNGVPIYLRDVGAVELGYRKATHEAYYRERRMIAMNAVKEPGSNVLDVMKGLRESVARINAELLAPRGLALNQVWDETDYIYSAIGLVRQNLFLGGGLAIVVLLLFLRSVTSTLVIAVAIPISVIGTFLLMLWFDRTLNVISLAGMAFAVGMVVDNSIVVLENIYRHRQMGKARFQAAYDGAREVWGAVLASTLTTIAVFVPVVFVQEEAGQLFRDIAIAISCAVALSLAIAITVIPSLSARILHVATPASRRLGFHNLFGLAGVARFLSDLLTRAVYWLCGGTVRRLAVVVGLTTVALGSSYILMPNAEYLPLGNQNFVFGFLLPPPGYNLEEMADLRLHYTEKLGPLWETPEEDAKDLAGGGIQHSFFVVLHDRAFMGARSRDPERARELIPEYQRVNQEIPGAIGFVNQASIFQRGLGEGRNIDIDLTGPELERLIELGGEVFMKVMQGIPGAQARPIPSLDLGNPEVQVLTHRRRAAEMNISNRDLGFTVSALVDGAKASDYQLEGKEIDLKVMAQESFAHRTHLLHQMPIATPDGRLVTLGSVAEITETNGPVQINHRERQRAITIQLTPPEQTPLQTAMETVRNDILKPMEQAGRLGGLYRASLSGSADKLTQTFQSFKWNFLLAIVITYLLMAALFESFLYPLVIMFSVPMAALGGVLGLAAMNRFVSYQALDVLTMLGFVILVGTVVNNAILIVHQSLNHLRAEELAPREAIRLATASRIRPIFMSVMTSVCGMLPLVLFPGPGSELYRGLGSVVVGGLLVSTIFTLFLVPSLFSLVMDARLALAGHVRKLAGGEEAPKAQPGD